MKIINKECDLHISHKQLRHSGSKGDSRPRELTTHGLCPLHSSEAPKADQKLCLKTVWKGLPIYNCFRQGKCLFSSQEALEKESDMWQPPFCPPKSTWVVVILVLQKYHFHS